MNEKLSLNYGNVIIKDIIQNANFATCFPPENPLQRKKPLLMRIKVYKGTQLIRDHQKDFRSHITREWINNLLLWAMNNKFRVEFHAE